MLNLSFQELFLRGIPEGFLIMFAVNTFSDSSIKSKKYIISSSLYIILVYFIRLLPIQAGVHTILNIFIVIFLSSYINKIDTVTAIRSSIIAIILEFLCETVDVLILKNVFKVDINSIFDNPSTRILYGLPSLVLFCFFIIILKLMKTRKVN